MPLRQGHPVLGTESDNSSGGGGCASCGNRTGCEVRLIRERFTGPERLVGIGLRCWLAGYETGDIDCWETGWRVYSKDLGPALAKGTVTDLACWVRAISANTCRKIEYYPVNCAEFCRDECLGVSMIAAGQHRDCPLLESCAAALIGCERIGEVVNTAKDFARALANANLHLSDAILARAAMLTGHDARA